MASQLTSEAIFAFIGLFILSFIMIMIKAVCKKQKQDNVQRAINAYPPIITIRPNDLPNGILQSTFPYNTRNTLFIPQNNILKPNYAGEAPPPYPGILDTTPAPNFPNLSTTTTTITTTNQQRHSLSTPIIMRLFDDNNNSQNNQANNPPPYEDIPGSTNIPQSAIIYPNPIIPDPKHVLPQK